MKEVLKEPSQAIVADGSKDYPTRLGKELITGRNTS